MARTYGSEVSTTDTARDPASTPSVGAGASAELAPAHAGRVALILTNYDAAAPVFLRFGTGAAANNVGPRLAAGQTLVITGYTGRVAAFNNSGAGVSVGVADI